ncbi:class I SAM-dependent methyltransferase [Candidatus Albibeggiatoa sp. nov. NOAA]|uniref:class I SAM-dependent methyltransferase n=1 Tax=Candidatus Albibeggiatoa sp. nov. NOAA TaxID=3162724 RepID=UPI0032FC3360|nr:class I SAM-dependent methyltransferase [Thiotrichaceae bacterium]
MTSIMPKQGDTCPICKQHTLALSKQTCTDYISKQSFSLLHCTHCGCYVTHGELQQDYYGQAYYNSKKGKFSPLIEKIFKLNHQRNAKQFYQRFQPKRILEIGCGRAYLLKELKQLDCEVYCLESDEAADWILNNADVNMITESKLDFPAQYFDLIIYWHVFEHLPDPVASLRQMTTLLADNQRICISVPNADSYQAKLQLSTWFHLDVPRHLYHFTPQSLVMLLESEGYEIESIEAGDMIQNLYGWLQSLANLFTPKEINGFYRFLQGGKPLKTLSKTALITQLVTSIIWIPVGILGYLIETLAGKHGSITVYARKKHRKY